ncbi:hypothetical protein V6N12_074952 [Hibiscus sabdariffa]|uniref:Uncharacterized protein n=1 Tax=Hibiscus sabdariffa TaxID=183260 RepID=A0ABR1ZLL0_9ROSI
MVPPHVVPHAAVQARELQGSTSSPVNISTQHMASGPSEQFINNNDDHFFDVGSAPSTVTPLVELNTTSDSRLAETREEQESRLVASPDHEELNPRDADFVTSDASPSRLVNTPEESNLHVDGPFTTTGGIAMQHVDAISTNYMSMADSSA